MATGHIVEDAGTTLIYDASSRYYRAGKFVVDGNLFTDAVEEDVIPSRPDDSTYIVRAGEEKRPELIAHRVYKNSNLWWAIQQANQIFNPFEELQPGQKLRIPPLSIVNQIQRSRLNAKR